MMVRKMTGTEWNRYVNTADDMGDKFKAIIDRMGKEGIENFQKMIVARFSGDGVEQMTVSEWIVFIWRYHSELDRVERTGAEADKLLQWAIDAWLLNRHKDQLNILMLGQDERSRMRPDPPELEALREVSERLATYGTDLYASLSQWAMEAGYRPDEPEFTPRAAKMLVAKMLKYIEEACTFIQEVVLRGQTVAIQAENAFSGVAAIVDGIDKEQVDFMRNLQAGLEKRQKAMATQEDQLGLYSAMVDDAGAKVKKILEKAERYRLANPAEYEWVCPQCDWSGQLLKRQRSEGALVNVLDYWWVWKCPSCGEMLAYDKKHPLFDGKIVFSVKMWELVKDGKMTLADMAYVLETNPEHIVYALRTIYHDNLPEHVLKEWEEYDKASKQDIVDDTDELGVSEEIMEDFGEEEEEL